MSHEFWAWTLLVISFVLACAGTVLPGLPGLAFVVGGLIFHKYLIPDVFSWWTIATVVILSILSWLLDFFSGIYGAKIGGAGRYGLIGASLGGLLGIFFGIPGLILGPFLGAVIGDLYGRRRDINQLLKSGIGASLGFFISIIGRFILIGLSAAVVIADTLI